MSETEVAIARIEEHMKVHDEKLDRLVNYLEGNGRPGIKERLTEIQVKMYVLWASSTVLLGLVIRHVFA